MVSRVISWFGTIAVAVLVIWIPEACYAQQAKPTIEQILQVWKERQEKVATARFEMNCKDTIHKGSTSLLSANRRRAARLSPETETNPPRDMIVESKREVKLSGPKLSYVYDHQQWEPNGKKLYPEHYIDVFDGHLFKSLQDPSSGREDYPAGIVRKAKASQSNLKFPILPLILTCRGNHPQFFRELGKFQLTGQTVALAGRPCLELMKPSGGNDRRDVLYLDLKRDYVVVKEMILVTDKPNWQLDITYGPDASIGWVPRNWEYIIRFGGENRVLQSGTVTLTNYAINPRIDNNEFDIIFPARTRVHDESSGNYVQYIIQENGENGRKIPTIANPSYDDLQKSPKRTNRWTWVIVWSVIFALSLLTWIYLRLRRRRRGPQQAT